MPLSGWGKYPIPTSTEAADVPADLMQLVEALDVHTVLFASSEANRNTLYNGITAGALVVCAAAKTAWISLGSSNWLTVYSDTGWSSLGFSWATNWSDTGATRVRRVGAMVQFEVAATYSGPNVTGPVDGNIPNMEIVTLPSNRPTVNRVVSAAVVGVAVGTASLMIDGTVLLTDIAASSQIISGHFVRVTFTYMTG